MPEYLASAVNLKGQEAFSALVPLSGPAAKGESGWIHLAMQGSWKGHGKGEFAFTPQVFSQILANNSARRTPVSLDYEHDTLKTEVTGPKPASGFLKSLELRNDGQDLWGYVEWTPRASELIRAGEYKFSSPVVSFESKDLKTNKPTGAQLVGVALTNQPFLDGQEPIQLTRIVAMADHKSEPKGEVATEEKPAEDKPKDEPIALAESEGAPDAESAQLIDALAESSGRDKASVLSCLMGQLEALTKLITDQPIPMTAEAKPSEPEAPKALTQTVDDKFIALQQEQQSATVVALSTRLAALEAERAQDKAKSIESQVDDLISQGFVSDAQRDNAVWAFTQDPVRAKAIYSTKLVPLGTLQAGPEPKPSKAAQVDLTQFSPQDKATFAMLRGAGKSESTAAAIVVEQRGKVN